MTMQIRVDFGWVSVMLCALVCFGVLYNWLTAWMETRGYIEGYTALVVAGGVGVTLIGLAVFSWQFALLSIAAFLASGTPMILGSIARHVRRREVALRALKEEAHANNPTGVAK